MIKTISQIKMTLSTLSAPNQELLTELIMVNEGFSSFVYEDSNDETYQWDAGENPTWLYGLNLREAGDTSMGFLMTTYKLCQIESDLIASMSFFKALPSTVKVALFDMAYTLGVEGLLSFTTFISYLAIDEFTNAANDLSTTKWYAKDTTRAQKDQQLILKGQDAHS